MVYDMPVLNNIGVSYIFWKLLISTFQPRYGNLLTSNILSPGVLDVYDIPQNLHHEFLHNIGFPKAAGLSIQKLIP